MSPDEELRRAALGALEGGDAEIEKYFGALRRADKLPADLKALDDSRALYQSQLAKHSALSRSIEKATADKRRASEWLAKHAGTTAGGDYEFFRKTVTEANKKLPNLRDKRIGVEEKLDDLLEQIAEQEDALCPASRQMARSAGLLKALKIIGGLGLVLGIFSGIMNANEAAKDFEALAFLSKKMKEGKWSEVRQRANDRNFRSHFESDFIRFGEHGGVGAIKPAQKIVGGGAGPVLDAVIRLTKGMQDE